MRVEDAAIVSTLESMIMFWKKRYCYPSQKTILKILEKNWNMSVCRRTLNYHLRFLERSGYIKRYKAHFRDEKTGLMVFRTTRYYVLKSAEMLTNVAKKVAETAKRFFRVQLFAQYLSYKDKDLLKSAAKTLSRKEAYQINGKQWAEPPSEEFRKTFLRLKTEFLSSKIQKSR